MKPQTYRAMVVKEELGAGFTRSIVEQALAELPSGDVLVEIHYSSLNFKDALSATGNRGVTRVYPHTPGIDAAGIVLESASPRFHPGDPVLINAEAFGVSAPGGYSQLARVPADWVLPLPAGLTLRESMIYGVAGFTAAYSVDRLISAGVRPEQGEILVTGATGGVGVFAVAILAKEGFSVVAATGKADQEPWLKKLGATRVVGREEINDTTGKPLLKRRWAGSVDTVGGNYLATTLRSTQERGVVTACGQVASPELALTVFPFILRGVSLIGIDEVHVPAADRARIWEALGEKWKVDHLDELAHEVPLPGLETEIERILHGQQTGRVVVNLRAS